MTFTRWRCRSVHIASWFAAHAVLRGSKRKRSFAQSSTQFRSRCEDPMASTIKNFSERFRPPRRLIPTRAGMFTLGAPLILGIAAINAGNNLLFLLLGASLGL